MAISPDQTRKALRGRKEFRHVILNTNFASRFSTVPYKNRYYEGHSGRTAN